MNPALSKNAIWLHEKAAAAGQIHLEDKVYPLQFPHEVPGNIAIEQALLGAIMNAAENGDGLTAIRSIPYLRYDDFYGYSNGLIFRGMEYLFHAGKQPDTLQVIDELAGRRNKQGKSILDEIGGQDFILHLAAAVRNLNLESYAKTVMEESLRRATIAHGTLLVKIASSRSGSLAELANTLERVSREISIRLLAISGQQSQSLPGLLKTDMQTMREDFANPDYEAGITTGFSGIDKMLLGWRRQRFYVVGGATGMGKSAFLLSSALAAYRAGKKVAFINLELTRQEVSERIICNLATIDNIRLQQRSILPEEVRRFEDIAPLLERLGDGFNLTILEYPTLRDLTATVDSLMQRDNFDAIFVDYAGHTTIMNESNRANNQEHTTQIYKEINNWKKRYNVAVIAGCQISRAYFKRKSKRPELVDLAYSSAIEQNADTVVFVHRPEIVEESPDVPGRAEAIIAKNRAGKNNKAIGTVYMFSEMNHNRFSEWNDMLAHHVNRDLADL